MSEKIWLFKADPKDYSIADLANEPNQTTSWDGIRNYMARNLIRDEIKKGDKILLYHSNADPKGIVGLGKVVRSAYPDDSALDQSGSYYDPKSANDISRSYRVERAERHQGFRKNDADTAGQQAFYTACQKKRMEYNYAIGFES